MASRLTARDHAHLFRYVHYDVVFHPDRVNAAEWLREGARYQNDLASGKIITGVQATKAALGNR